MLRFQANLESSLCWVGCSLFTRLWATISISAISQSLLATAIVANRTTPVSRGRAASTPISLSFSYNFEVAISFSLFNLTQYYIVGSIIYSIYPPIWSGWCYNDSNIIYPQSVSLTINLSMRNEVINLLCFGLLFIFSSFDWTFSRVYF